MKRTRTVEQLLSASRPHAPGSTPFVERTMQAVERAATAQQFASTLADTKRSKKQSALVWFKHLPKVAMVAIVALGIAILSGTAYAAYRWLEPHIDIMGIAEFDNSRTYTVDVKDCGVVVGGASIGNGTKRYEVAKDSTLSDTQIKKVLHDSCQYQQTIEMMQKRWHDPIPQAPPAVGDVVTSMMVGTGGTNGIDDPGVGTITSIEAGRITIAYTLYQQYKDSPALFILPDAQGDIKEPKLEYFPEGKAVTRTLNLSPDLEVVYNGNTVKLGDLHKGDTVFLISEVTYTIQDGPEWQSPQSVQLARIIKMDIDPAYVLGMPLGNPNIVGGITLLGGCQGNGKYLCIQPVAQNIKYQIVYTSGVATEMAPWDEKRFGDNKKYFRTDIDFNKQETGSYFHSIEGRVVRIDGTTVTLASRGNVQVFTIELPYDAIADYNKTTKQHLRVGDLIKVSYMQKTGEDITHVKSSDLQGLMHVMRRLPNGSLRSY